MIQVVFEAVWLLIKKLFDLFGFALVLMIVLFLCILFVRDYSEEKAMTKVYKENVNVSFLSVEEQTPEKSERVFRVKIKNNESDGKIIGTYYVTDENGEDLHASFENINSDVGIRGNLCHNTNEIPAGCENYVIMRIDKGKLRGQGKIYISEVSDHDEKGKEFKIKESTGES